MRGRCPGTPVPHIPQPARPREDARQGERPGCGVPGAAPPHDEGTAAGDSVGWHSGGTGTRPAPAGNGGRAERGGAGLWGRTGSWMCPFTVQLLKSADLGRQSLLYLKEIGHGWFGKVSAKPGGAEPGLWGHGDIGIVGYRGRGMSGHRGTGAGHVPDPGLLLCHAGTGAAGGCACPSGCQMEGSGPGIAGEDLAGRLCPLPRGVPGGGELGHQQHPGGGEGAEGQRQRAGPDAVPGGSAALQVGAGSLRGADPAPGTSPNHGLAPPCVTTG